MPRLSVELLCRCTGHANKRRKDESQEQFLARVTHLYCSEKNIEYIVSIYIIYIIYIYTHHSEVWPGDQEKCVYKTHKFLQ